MATMIWEIERRSRALSIAVAGLKVFRAFTILFFLGLLALHLLQPHQFPPLTFMEVMRVAGAALIFGAFLGFASCFFDMLRALVPWKPRKPTLKL